MLDEIMQYYGNTVDKFGYDLGVGFVDIETGQEISIRGDDRYHAMSSFKGPLAVHYLWLIEQGEITPIPSDEKHIIPMLSVSSNEDTSCIFKRVGGIAAFNDWLADQGFSRDRNFVLDWREWACNENGDYYVPQIDLRYTRGDETLGLPGGGQLLQCPIKQLPCDKAFSPMELARFYARVYNHQVINEEHLDQLLGWMEKGKDQAVFLNLLPPGSEARVYIKGGTRQSDEIYRVNFFSEAGIVETPNGAFALAIFMQRNPKWPGTDPMSRVAQIIYSYFTATHPQVEAP
jgi:hypothetical protein